jgi:hypothetical protein
MRIRADRVEQQMAEAEGKSLEEVGALAVPSGW